MYMLISTLLMVALLICFKILIKKDERKNLVVKVCAILTVILHYSSLYVDYFSVGEALVESTMLLPIYPCHIVMWLLVIVAFYKNKSSKIYKLLAEATFYIGIVGGTIGIMFNENYFNNPNLAEWGVLKGMLSHSTMLLGCIYLKVGDFIKIRVSNLYGILTGLCILIVDGFLVISIFRLFDMEPPNAMYLLENPFPSIPWINTWAIGILGIVIGFIITSVYELMCLEKKEHWYYKLINKEGENEHERIIN